MTPRIDLHTHSTASDGTTPPDVLVRQARAAGLDVVALTDHDTTGGWAAAAEALPAGLSLVRGAEISCVRGGISLHLLAYLFDPDEPALATALQELRGSRVGRAETMARMLEADGTGVTWERVQELAGGTVGRPHVAAALVEQGHIASVAEAFTPDWIGDHGRYWVAKTELDVLDAIALVVGAGGVPVFAHPAASSRGRTVGADVIADMAAAGLVGLEVDHVDHDEHSRQALADLAAHLGLAITGSSDFHGENKQVQLGAYTTSPPAYEQLMAAARSGTAVLSG
ncbi:MAG: PHP domain-containing protein [Actinomycetota bacterium]|nr:PHP domain-containing protein [Actinomycetota bacterium]